MWHLVRKQLKLQLQLDPPYSHIHCSRTSTDSPRTAPVKSAQQYNQCNLWLEPIGWRTEWVQQNLPQNRRGERTQVEHLGYSILTKLRDGHQVCVSPHCVPSPGWPSLSHPFPTTQPPCTLTCNHPGSHSLLLPAQLRCPSQERARKWIWQTLLPQHPPDTPMDRHG